MRLLEKISTLVIVLAIFISLVLGVVVYNLTKSEMEQSVGQNQLQLTRATMQGIDRVLYERCQDIREVAGSVVFKKYLDNRSNEADVEERLGIYLATSGPWDALEIWDKEGNLAFSSEGQQEGKIRTKDGQEQNFLRAALGGEDYVSDLVISGYSGKPTVYFVFPMRDETLPDRPVVGAAMGQFSWSVIEQIVADAENGTSHAYLLNSRKEIIAEGGERNKLFRTNAGSDREGQAEKAVGIWKGTGISPLLWSRAAQTGYLNYRGNGWELTIDTPASAAFSSADESSWKTVEALLAIMLLKVIVLLIFLNSLVIRPLRKLETTAREISAGELEKRAAVTTKDEIGLLAQSLNQMTDKLLETAKFPESIIASMADALIVLRADKRIKMVNKSVQVLLGYGEKELIGRPVDDIMACETDENGNTTSCVGINQLVRRGHMKDTKEKVNFKTKSGELLPMSISGSVLRNEKGEITDMIIVAKDLREMQQLQKEKLEILEQASRELEEKIRERTINLDAANQQLVSSNQQLEAANRQLAAAQEQLLDKVNELERFNRVTMGREARILELKAEIVRLKKLTGEKKSGMGGAKI